MRDSWITLAGSLLALLLFAALLYPQNVGPPLSYPTSEDDRDNGYAGLKYWLEEAAVPFVSHQHSYAELMNLDGVSEGNILLSVMPHKKALEPEEIHTLKEWLQQGNTLVLLAALNDTPYWVMQTDTETFIDEIKILTGMSFEVALNEEDEVIEIGSAFEGEKRAMLPLRGHPLMEGVDELATVTDTISSIWLPVYGFYHPALRLGIDSEEGIATLWEIPEGPGRIILSASSTLLTNGMLDKADNAQFVANILAWHLGENGTVLFDDYHQGLSQLYEADDFFADRRLHYTVLFILAFWLVYLVGSSARLTKPPAQQVASHQTDLVLATGGLMVRKLNHQDAGKTLVETWVQDLKRAALLRQASADGIPWEEIAALHPREPVTLDAVRESYIRLGRGEKVSLAALQNNIIKLKRSRV